MALFTTEAEYVAMGGCVAQLLCTFLWQTRKDYKLHYKKVQVLIDNISSINLTKNHVHHSMTEHIEVKDHFVREHIANSDLKFKYVESKSNIADIFTNPLIETEFSTLKRRLGLYKIY